MLTREDIHSAITKNVIGFDVSRIKSDEDNLMEVGLDSLDHASVLLTIEEVHGVSIPDDIAGDLISVKAILDHARNSAADGAGSE